MDILESITLEIYENKEDWREGDYIEIMNLLKDFFNDVKGYSSQKYIAKDIESEDEDLDYFIRTEYDDDGFRIDPSYTDSPLPSFLRST